MTVHILIIHADGSRSLSREYKDEPSTRRMIALQTDHYKRIKHEPPTFTVVNQVSKRIIQLASDEIANIREKTGEIEIIKFSN